MDKKYLLPPNGINGSWSQICKRYNFQNLGFKDRNKVFSMQLTNDFKIEVTDIRQNSYNNKNELYTTVTFEKKFLDASSYRVEKALDNVYTVYYPYGTRLDDETLVEVGLCLNALMNKARDLPENAVMLPAIKGAEQALVNLFNTGCENSLIIDTIMSMSGVSPIYGFYDTHVRCRTNIEKDSLPDIQIAQTQQEAEPTA